MDEPAVRARGARRASVRARDVRRQVRCRHARGLDAGLGRQAAGDRQGPGRGRGGGERRAPPVPDRRAQGAPDGRRDRRGRRRELASRHPDARDEHPWRRRLHRHGARARPGGAQRGVRRARDRRDLSARADPGDPARRGRTGRDRGPDPRVVGGPAAHRGGVPGGDPAATERQPGGLGIDLGAAVVQTGRGRARPGRPARGRGLEPARPGRLGQGEPPARPRGGRPARDGPAYRASGGAGALGRRGRRHARDIGPGHAREDRWPRFRRHGPGDAGRVRASGRAERERGLGSAGAGALGGAARRGDPAVRRLGRAQPVPLDRRERGPRRARARLPWPRRCCSASSRGPEPARATSGRRC